jgi:hypothetical protein
VLGTANDGEYDVDSVEAVRAVVRVKEVARDDDSDDDDAAGGTMALGALAICGGGGTVANVLVAATASEEVVDVDDDLDVDVDDSEGDRVSETFDISGAVMSAHCKAILVALARNSLVLIECSSIGVLILQWNDASI